jgi:hypothetical protein
MGPQTKHHFDRNNAGRRVESFGWSLGNTLVQRIMGRAYAENRRTRPRCAWDRVGRGAGSGPTGADPRRAAGQVGKISSLGLACRPMSGDSP